MSTSLVNQTIILILLGLNLAFTAIAEAKESNVPENLNQRVHYRPYVKGPVCFPEGPVRHPTTTDEVVSIVREALRRNTTCKAFGALHSITDIVCTEGIAIDMTGIRQMKMSRDGTTVMVGAGVSIRDLTDFLMIIGRALRGIPGFGNVTVGGVVGTGAHGTSLKYESTISDQLVSLLIVDGLGNLRTISDETDLRAFRVHLGLLGIIIQLTFKTVPLYKVRAHNYVLGDEILKNGVVEEMAKVTDQLGLYWFPSLQKVVVANWTFVDVRTPGNAETNDHVPSTTRSLNWYMNRFVERAARYDSLQTWHLGVAYFAATLYRKIPDNVPIYSEDGIHVQNPAVGFYHRMFAPICKSTGWIQCPWLHGNEGGISFTDNEFSFELSRLPEVISTVEDILSKYPAVFPVYGILLRFSKPSNTYMSTSYGRVTCHLEFYMKTRKNAYEDPSLGLAAYQAIVQSLALNYTGRSHWGKSGSYFHGKDILALKVEPKARKAFLSKMAEFDPNQVFMNDFGRRLRGVGTKSVIDPGTRHCALLDNCVCSLDSDCAKGQMCSRIQGYPDYPVCTSPPRSPEDNVLHPEPFSKEGLRLYWNHLRKLIANRNKANRNGMASRSSC